MPNGELADAGEARGSFPDAAEASGGLQPGLSIGKRYRLVRELGAGASGTVWEAEHKLLTSRVAIKFLEAVRGQPVGTAEILLGRFRFEAQLSARLGARTEHIVCVHDAGMFNGVPFIVMELAPGDTVEQKLEQAPLSPSTVAHLLDQVGEALDAAHAAGVAHRDVKPANVLYVRESADGTVMFKLADFGVAKEFSDQGMGLTTPKQTSENALVGSPAYMSPDYLSGAPTIDGRGDIWALAVTAYEALTQRLPFDGEAWTQIAVSITQGEFSLPSVHMPELGDAVDSFFARALSLDASKRYATAGELARAFRGAISARESAQALTPEPFQIAQEPEPVDVASTALPSFAPPMKKSRALPVLGGVAAVVAVIGFAAIFGSRGGKSAGSENDAASTEAATDQRSRSLPAPPDVVLTSQQQTAPGPPPVASSVTPRAPASAKRGKPPAPSAPPKPGVTKPDKSEIL